MSDRASFERRLATTLRALHDNPASRHNDWWIIGSVAALPFGLDHTPRDVDLFGSAATMQAFLEGFGVTTFATDEDPLFRSDPFAEIAIPEGLPIEVQGDLHVRKAQDWLPLHCRSRVEVTIAGLDMPVVEPQEQIAMFEFFGREKDLAKAEKLAALIAR